MKSWLTIVLFSISAISSYAQKYIDSQDIVWSVSDSTLCSEASSFGIMLTTDSLSFIISPFSSHLVHLTIMNNYNDYVSIIWDESTINNQAIVLGDMQMYQAGSSIKPSIIEGHKTLFKGITSEWHTKHSIQLFDIKSKTCKDMIKKLGYNIFLLDIFLCIEKNGNKTRHHIPLIGYYIGKKFKDKDDINRSQDFSQVNELLNQATKK